MYQFHCSLFYSYLIIIIDLFMMLHVSFVSYVHAYKVVDTYQITSFPNRNQIRTKTNRNDIRKPLIGLVFEDIDIRTLIKNVLAFKFYFFEYCSSNKSINKLNIYSSSLINF